MPGKKVKIPANQHLWQTIYDKKGEPKYLIASDAMRTKYYLYFWDGEKLNKVKIAASPEEFRTIIDENATTNK